MGHNNDDIKHQIYYLAAAAGGCVLILLIWNIYLTYRVKWLWRRLRTMETVNETMIKPQPEVSGNIIPRVNIRDPVPSRPYNPDYINGRNYPNTNQTPSTYY